MANNFRQIAQSFGAPYYDDFDKAKSKNYVKMLYNPGYALQARELTQSQTMLQNQIASVGSYLFKDGSAVDGAKISYSTKQPFIKINKTYNNALVKPEDFFDRNREDKSKNLIFYGQSSGQPIQITDFYEIGENWYLAFSYMGSDILVDRQGNPVNEEAFVTQDYQLQRGFTATAINNGLVASCTEGYIFIDGFFVYVPKKNICISVPADMDTEYHIGFGVKRSVVTANTDPDLHDPAAGMYNYKAPGADRYQILAELKALSSAEINELGEGANDVEKEFVSGVVIKGDVLIKEQNYDANAALMDMLARRTYEESGSYTTKPWKIQLYDDVTAEQLAEQKLTGSPSEYYRICVEPGSGYIYGYRVSTLVSQNLFVKKPRTPLRKEGNAVYVPKNIYTYAKYESDTGNVNFDFRALEAKSFPNLLGLDVVDVMSAENGLGTSLGTCRVTGIEKNGSVLSIYLTDVQDVLGKFSTARSFKSRSNGSFVNLYTNEDDCAVIYGTDTPKIYPTGYLMVTPEVDNTNPMTNSLVYEFTKSYQKSVEEDTSSISLTLNWDSEKRHKFDKLLYIHDEDGKHISIESMGVEWEQATNTVTIKELINGSVFKKGVTYTICGTIVYNEGDVADTNRVSTLRTKTLTTVEAESISVPAEADKVELANEDIFHIYSVLDADGNDVTDRLVFDNGQTDYLYGKGSLSGFKALRTSADANKAKTYTVKYVYYKHGASIGAFSAGSYINDDNRDYLSKNPEFAALYPDLYAAIPVYRSVSTGTRYKLRDCLDFRMKASELGTNAVSRYPNANSNITFNASIYQPRIDAVWIDKNGEFGVTEGIESQTPEVPEEKDGTMTIYYLYNEPYVTSIEKVGVQYVNNQRKTMKDIINIENRLTNVENVVSLTLLEQSAVNMQITDAEGLNRYKTGIFTDSFGDFSNSDYTNADWNCTIDAVECSVRPLFEVEEHPFKLDNNTTSAYRPTANVATYDDVIMTIQPNASTTVLCENKSYSEVTNIQSLMFYVWAGSLKLSPSIDTWVNDLGQKIVSTKYVETPKPPTTYRTWSVSSVVDTKNTSVSSTSTSRRSANDGWGSYWTDTYRNTTTTTTQTIETKTTTETTSYTGSWATSDVYTHMESQDAYMRSRTIEYSLKGMRQGMEVRAEMDGVDITHLLSHRKVGSDGTLTGTFVLPEKFMTCGTKLVEFFDAELTSAAATEYTANGKTVWTNVDRTYIRTWTSFVTADTKTSYSTRVAGVSTTRTKISSVYRDLDPIAESFYIDSPNGVMLESIDLFFASKDSNVGVEVIIVECENGYPSEKMVPFSRVAKTPAEVSVVKWDDAKNGVAPVKTNFKFDTPVYLAPNTEYAFIVIAPSYNYELYTSTLGAADLSNNGIGIREQPYIGSMFKSQNLRTWSAEQLSDIKFCIHKYVYDTSVVATAKFDVVYEDEEGFETAMQTLAINSFVPNQTSVSYEYAWGDSPYAKFNNREDIFNPAIRTLVDKNLHIYMTLKTNDANISPMIDLEQVYGIFTQNIVKPLDNGEGFDCGTYISNNVSLDNASDDLRVILDAALPKESSIEVSFKTTAYKPIFVNQATGADVFSSADDAKSLIGSTMQVYHYNSTTKSFELPTTTKQSLCVIAGYKDGRVYLRSVSSPDDFYNLSGSSYVGMNSNFTMVALLPIIGVEAIPCPTWSAESKKNVDGVEYNYLKGDYVLYGGYMWQAQMNTISVNVPTDLSIVWKKIVGIKTISQITEDDEITWRPMKLNSMNNSTLSASNFVEYTYVPEIEIETEFNDFAIRIDMKSKNKVDVPRVKNLRAIAIV